MRGLPVVIRGIVSSGLPAIVQSSFRSELAFHGDRGLSSKENQDEPRSMSIQFRLLGARSFGELTWTLRRLLASAKNSSEKETIFPPRATEDTSRNDMPQFDNIVSNGSQMIAVT
jgi:hypothetical protein